MTPEGLLFVLCNRGDASICVREDRLRIEAPRGVLSPSIREGLATHKADLLRLVAVVEEYRALLRSDLDDSLSLDAQARLIDELGPRLATAVRQAVSAKVGQDLRHA